MLTSLNNDNDNNADRMFVFAIYFHLSRSTTI